MRRLLKAADKSVRKSNSDSRELWVLGSIAMFLYAVVAAIFWTDAVFDNSGTVSRLLSGIIGALTIMYFVGLRWIQQATVRTIVLFSVVFALIGFVSGPIDSTDVYFYAAQGWEQSHYGVNPYTQVLRDIENVTDDPMIGSKWMVLNRNPWLDEPMPYGFAFALLTRGLAWIGSGHLWLTLFLFNAINLLCHATICILLWRIATLVPQINAKLVLYLYAWSPLVVLQFLVDAHNDLIMAVFILLAFYCWINGRTAWVVPCMIVAGLVKYVALALIPFTFCLVWRRAGYKNAAKSFFISLAILAAFSAPYIGTLSTFKTRQIVEQFTERSGSLHAFLRFGYRVATRVINSGSADVESFSLAANVLLWSIAGIYAVYRLHRAWSGREDAPADIARRWTSVLFMIVFVASSQCYPWYIGIIFPLSLVGTGASVLTSIIVLLSGTHMAFGFLRSKAIGYFLLSTALPAILAVWHHKRIAQQMDLGASKHRAHIASH